MLGLTGGDIALIVAAVAWVALVFFLAIVLVVTSRVLESTKHLIDGIRQETVPLLSEVTTSVRGVNKELDRVDGLLESAGKLSKSVERITGAVEHAITSPLVKFAAFSAGASAALKRIRGEK